MNAVETGLGLYCHVPFCASTCDFCAFYQEKPKRKDLDRYLEGMESELQWTKPDRPIDTVFWGGGTPGLLPAKDLARLAEAVLGITRQQPLEWTVEMAPSTVKPEKLKVLKEHGVNRISMGVQSFDEKFLDSLGRLHRPNQIYKAYDWIREAGFRNVNLDMMIALPGQSAEELRRDLREACRLEPEHLSTYCLTFEEDTALWVKLSNGELKQDIEKDADLYELTWSELPEAGYEHYEISNFAKPGKACIHNLNTWKMKDWIGVGPSAASQYENVRYSNPADLDAWLLAADSDIQERAGVTALSDADLLEDALVFGLRMGEGISIQELTRRFPSESIDAYLPFLHSLKTDCLATVTNQDRIQLTPRGKLLADRIAVELIK